MFCHHLIYYRVVPPWLAARRYHHQGCNTFSKTALPDVAMHKDFSPNWSRSVTLCRRTHPARVARCVVCCRKKIPAGGCWWCGLGDYWTRTTVPREGPFDDTSERNPTGMVFRTAIHLRSDCPAWSGCRSLQRIRPVARQAVVDHFGRGCHPLFLDDGFTLIIGWGQPMFLFAGTRQHLGIPRTICSSDGETTCCSRPSNCAGPKSASHIFYAQSPSGAVCFLVGEGVENLYGSSPRWWR